MWTIRDLGFAHRLGRWKRNPNRDGHLSGKPWNGGQPCPPLRLNHPLSITPYSTLDGRLPGPVRTTLARLLSISSPLSHLPSCPVRLLWYPYPTADPGHTLMPTSKLFSLFIKPLPSLRLRGGTNPSCPSTVSSNPVSATIQNIINACSCSKVGSSASSSLRNTTAALLLAPQLLVFLDSLSETSHHIKSQSHKHPHVASHPPRLASPHTNRGLPDIGLSLSLAEQTIVAQTATDSSRHLFAGVLSTRYRLYNERGQCLQVFLPFSPMPTIAREPRARFLPLSGDPRLNAVTTLPVSASW